MASRIQLQITITGKETKHMFTATCVMLRTTREGTITKWVNNTSFQLSRCMFLTDLHIAQPRSDSFHILQISQMQILIASMLIYKNSSLVPDDEIQSVQ